jgi:hypothetical protein
MANHVHNYIEIVGNERCIEAFEKCINSILFKNEQGRMEYKPVEDLNFMPKHPRDQEGWLINAYDYYIDNVGAKWAYIEDAESTYVTLTSAWSPVSAFVGHLVQYLSGFDPNVMLKHDYTDESHLFVGVQRVTSDGEPLFDYDEIEWGWIVEEFLKEGVDVESNDFEWWETSEALDGHTPEEWLEGVVYNWREKAWKLMMN